MKINLQLTVGRLNVIMEAINVLRADCPSESYRKVLEELYKDIQNQYLRGSSPGIRGLVKQGDPNDIKTF